MYQKRMDESRPLLMGKPRPEKRLLLDAALEKHAASETDDTLAVLNATFGNWCEELMPDGDWTPESKPWKPLIKELGAWINRQPDRVRRREHSEAIPLFAKCASHLKTTFARGDVH
jgi:hypothetical protein